MKSNTFKPGVLLLLTTLFIVSTLFTSCYRQLKIKDIKAIENTEERISTWCYYYNGYYLQQPLKARTNFLLNKHHYETGVDRKLPEQYIGDEFLGLGDFIVLAGDTLIPLDYVWCTNGKTSSVFLDRPFAPKNEWVETKFQVIRDGKVAGEGWKGFRGTISGKYLEPYAWTRIFADWKGWMAGLIFFGGFFALIHRIGLKIYRKKKRKKGEVDITKGMYFPFIYVIFALLLGGLFIYLFFNPSEAASLYYNPNIIKHWSEYALVVKSLPFLLTFLILSAIIMFFEMKKKMKSFGFIFHYIGWLATGLFFLGMMLLSGLTVYALFIFILPFIAIMFSKGFGGGSSQSSNRTPDFRFRDEDGHMHVSGVDRDAANKKIAERKAQS